MFFNYHTHTRRCHHAEGEDREYVERAIEAGMKTLGFSDHAPYLFPEGSVASKHRMTKDELEEYAHSIRTLQKEYADDIRILCGFELEYYPDFHTEEMQFLRKITPDYILLGQHFLGNELSFLTAHQSHDLALTAYVTQVLAGLSTGDFLYLAHPDIAGYEYSDETVEREYRRLCEGAKRMNVPLEFNLLGVRARRYYPNERFFRIVAEVGNEVVLGYDAHSPESLLTADVENKAKALLEGLGVNLIDKDLL